MWLWLRRSLSLLTETTNFEQQQKILIFSNYFITSFLFFLQICASLLLLIFTGEFSYVRAIKTDQFSIMTVTWYSGSQALFIAVAFGTFDVLMNVFGLAWNGSTFTFANIQHWFDLKNYCFKQNPVDFLVSFPSLF